MSAVGRRWGRFAWRVLRWLAIGYLGILLLLLCLERSLVYPVPPVVAARATDFGGEDIQFLSADGTQLHGWFFASPGSRKAVLYCHGNGDQVAWLGDYAAGLRDAHDCNVMVFDYRGYGRSHGQPDEAGVLADGRAAQQWLAERLSLADDDLVLMGRSLGGGVAVELAAQHGARGLILQNTFTSLTEAAAAHFPWLPVRWVMRNRYESDQKIDQFHGPLLQSHGTADEVIPFRLGEELHRLANSPKAFFPIPDGRHNDPEPQAYDQLLTQFLLDVYAEK